MTFEMPGFQTLIRENVILQSGATQTINAELGLAQVSETVTVSSESPVVDVRETGIPQAFDNERLENIPSARDPWVILEQTPGMLMDRQNVGGNESGQQSGFYNRGTDFAQNQWVYDGVNITDMGAAGATPFYFDFGAFEEMNITTGGQDPSSADLGHGHQLRHQARAPTTGRVKDPSTGPATNFRAATSMMSSETRAPVPEHPSRRFLTTVSMWADPSLEIGLGSGVTTVSRISAREHWDSTYPAATI